MINSNVSIASRRVCMVALSTCAMWFPHEAFAQSRETASGDAPRSERSAPANLPPALDEKQDPAGQGADIIVTAQRREQRLIDVPVSISAMSGIQLQKVGILSTSELSAISPGLQSLSV